MKKALVALPDDIWDIIDRELEGKLGNGYSDTIRSIVLSWLSENGYLSKGGKPRVDPRDPATLRDHHLGV